MKRSFGASVSGTMPAGSEAHDFARIADPWAAIFGLSRIKTAIIVILLGFLGVQEHRIYRLAQGTAAHVYEVMPDGQVNYVAQREALLQPRPHEAVHVAKAFFAALYAWNSSTVAQDIAAAVTMCEAQMAQRMRDELASVKFIEMVRSRQWRSELDYLEARIIEDESSHKRVRIRAKARHYAIDQYEGMRAMQRQVGADIVLAVVRRTPEHRPNGLEVVRMEHLTKLAPTPRVAPDDR